MRRLLVLGPIALVAACAVVLTEEDPPEEPAPAPVAAPAPEPPPTLDDVLDRPAPAPEVTPTFGGPLVRVAIATASRDGRVGGTSGWRLEDGNGHGVLVRESAGGEWTIERTGRRLAATIGDRRSASSAGPLVLRADDGGLVSWNGRRYRGELAIHAAGDGIVVVNRVPLESYLRGVVAREIGPRTMAEIEAVKAQAVAARSYALIRLGAGGGALYDLRSTVADQVYGGADGESPVADAAVAATAGLVLTYGGRIVNAPYHSTCGGTTAEATELWRTDGEPYLQRVSDRIPGTDRHYCDESPRFQWTRTLSRSELEAALRKYLRQYVASAPAGELGRPRHVAVERRTPSGRVAVLSITTDRRRYELRRNDIRFVLRAPNGEILNSTYFSVATTMDGGGRIATLTLRGSGYGHGVGMCQWGAIGRARAGQDFRTILRTYYPGTTVESAR